jgi:hypothetical protein
MTNTVPYEKISITDRMNLMDIGRAVSALVKEKYMTQVAIQRENAALKLTLAHHIRTPLMSASIATSLIKHFSIRMLANSEDTSDSKGFSTSLDDLDSSLKRVEKVLEKCMTITSLLTTQAGESPFDRVSSKQQLRQSQSLNVLIWKGITSNRLDEVEVIGAKVSPVALIEMALKKISSPNQTTSKPITKTRVVAMSSEAKVSYTADEASLLCTFPLWAESQNFLLTVLKTLGDQYRFVRVYTSTVSLDVWNSNNAPGYAVFRIVADGWRSRKQSNADPANDYQISIDEIEDNSEEILREMYTYIQNTLEILIREVQTCDGDIKVSIPDPSSPSLDIIIRLRVLLETSNPALNSDKEVRPVIVLVVDDSLPIQKGMRRFLETRGMCSGSRRKREARLAAAGDEEVRLCVSRLSHGKLFTIIIIIYYSTMN